MARKIKSTIISFLIIMFIVTVSVALAGISGGNSITKSTTNREKVEGVVWENDCVIDELGWFEDIPYTESQLQYFYNEMGIQPFVYLRAYDEMLTDDMAKEAYAEEWYDMNIDDEGTLLFMYFAEYPDDDGSGLMTLVNGKNISAVMDAEAVQIFWDYIDSMWDDPSVSTDNLFIKAFNKTADRVMYRTTTGMDIAKWAAVAVAVICVGTATIMVMKLRRQHKAAEAEETQRILETPVETLVKDDLLSKYEDKGE